MGFMSLKKAIADKKDCKKLTITILKNNVNEHGACFVRNSNGNMIPKYGKGVLVKFSGYLHLQHNVSDAMKGIVFPAE